MSMARHLNFFKGIWEGLRFTIFTVWGNYQGTNWHSCLLQASLFGLITLPFSFIRGKLQRNYYDMWEAIKTVVNFSENNPISSYYEAL